METETNNEAKKAVETTGAAKKAAGAGLLANNKLTVAVVALTATVIVSTAVIVDTLQRNNYNDDPAPVYTGGMTIDYETDAKVFLDQNSLQAAMDEAMKNAKDRNVALRYQNDASSKDGRTFSCYIANSSGNIYDMFLTICSDADMTDQLFVSKLLRPGTGYDSITLNRALEEGDHMVYVAVTLVDTDDTGAQVIKAQVVHTMDFHVTG